MKIHNKPLKIFSFSLALITIGMLIVYQNCGKMRVGVRVLGFREPSLGFLTPSSVERALAFLRVDSDAQDLLNQMSLHEKIGLLKSESPPIPRLGIPAYDYWSEDLHGPFTWGGAVTVFPMPITMASSWDPELTRIAGSVTSDEQRGLYHRQDSIRMSVTNPDDFGMQGLSGFAPMINIVRDPRWGRIAESYGEDPLLTGLMGSGYASGMQGDDPVYFKMISTLKHFAAHSGPEAVRDHLDTNPTAHDLMETYLPAFTAAVQRVNAYSVMCAYTKFHGNFACQSKELLTDYLRVQMGFQGFVVTDCGALTTIPWVVPDHTQASLAQSAQKALEAGVNVECAGDVSAMEAMEGAIQNASSPVQQQYLTGLVDRAVLKLLTARIRMGNIGSNNPYNQKASEYISGIDSQAHRDMALKAARESLVLLKNSGSVLPLSKGLKVTVIGPAADDKRTADTLGTDCPRFNIMFGGNYSGAQKVQTTPLDGIKAIIGSANAVYAKGFEFYGELNPNNSTPDYSQALSAAGQSDAIVFVGGLDEQLEGEGLDRTSLYLPKVQDDLIHLLRSTYPQKPFVLVLINGSMVLSRYLNEIPSVLEAWYPGEEGGRAIAEILFGDISPSGKLPVTFYADINQLPPYDNYDMRAQSGRTYKYFKGAQSFEFGFGLSYMQFNYTDLRLPSTVMTNQSTTITVSVQNAGSKKGDEIVEVYVGSRINGSWNGSPRRLIGFQRISLNPGEKRDVNIKIDGGSWGEIDEGGVAQTPSGLRTVTIGGRQPSDAAINSGEVLQKDVGFDTGSTATKSVRITAVTRADQVSWLPPAAQNCGDVVVEVSTTGAEPNDVVWVTADDDPSAVSPQWRCSNSGSPAADGKFICLLRAVDNGGAMFNTRTLYINAALGSGASLVKTPSPYSYGAWACSAPSQDLAKLKIAWIENGDKFSNDWVGGLVIAGWAYAASPGDPITLIWTDKTTNQQIRNAQQVAGSDANRTFYDAYKPTVDSHVYEVKVQVGGYQDVCTFGPVTQSTVTGCH